MILRLGSDMMKRRITLTVCFLLLLALCGCRYEGRFEGTWQGDGSLEVRTDEVTPISFDGAERWVFDGEGTAIATVRGKQVECRYYATDDALTLNGGEEMSYSLRYELKGDTLRIGNAYYTKVK